MGLSIHIGKKNKKRWNSATVGYAQEEKRKVPVRWESDGEGGLWKNMIDPKKKVLLTHKNTIRRRRNQTSNWERHPVQRGKGRCVLSTWFHKETERKGRRTDLFIFMFIFILFHLNFITDFLTFFLYIPHLNLTHILLASYLLPNYIHVIKIGESTT